MVGFLDSKTGMNDFQDWDDDKPNLHELTDYLLMINKDIHFVLTWDNDYTHFPDLTLLPRGYW